MENPKLFATEVLKEVIINEGSDSSKGERDSWTEEILDMAIFLGSK